MSCLSLSLSTKGQSSSSSVAAAEFSHPESNKQEAAAAQTLAKVQRQYTLQLEMGEASLIEFPSWRRERERDSLSATTLISHYFEQSLSLGVK